jgi:non-heme chloroperoxidase
VQRRRHQPGPGGRGRRPRVRCLSPCPAAGNRANRHRAVPLTYEQFRYSFANVVDEDQAHRLYDTFAVAAPGAPLWQAAAANFNPRTEDKVDTKNPGRGPMLVISGEKDHTVPPVLANAAYQHQSKNAGVTEFAEIPGRGHSLTIDDGWQEVADTALTFIRRFT